MEHTHDWVITKDDFEMVCARCYECESVMPLEEIERILNSSQQSVHPTGLGLCEEEGCKKPAVVGYCKANMSNNVSVPNEVFENVVAVLRMYAESEWGWDGEDNSVVRSWGEVYPEPKGFHFKAGGDMAKIALGELQRLLTPLAPDRLAVGGRGENPTQSSEKAEVPRAKHGGR